MKKCQRRTGRSSRKPNLLDIKDLGIQYGIIMDLIRKRREENQKTGKCCEQRAVGRGEQENPRRSACHGVTPVRSSDMVL